MTADRTAASVATKDSPPPRKPTGRKGITGAVGRRFERSAGGIKLLLLMVAAMWIAEIVNALDGNRLDQAAGIYPRNAGHLWSIFTSPFLHAGFGHLLSNTIPFLFMGAIIAVRGAARLAIVTLVVIVVSGLGVWLISPTGTDTVGASGVVFGYAAYLLARGFFNHRMLELLTGAIVGLVWGFVLIASLIPHGHVSWQGHLMGAIGGVLVAWLLAQKDRRGAGPAGWPGHATVRRPVGGSSLPRGG